MHRLQAPDVVAAIERAATEHLGRRWQLREFVDLNDRASHPAGIFVGEAPTGLRIFAKELAGDTAEHDVRCELDGLAFLRERGGARTPQPVGDGLVVVNRGCVLLLEAVNETAPSNRSVADWRAIGTCLASLHATTGSTFGHTADGSFGPLPQVNTPVESNIWSDFVRQRRIVPFLDEAVRSGNLPDGFAERVHMFTEHIEKYVGPEPLPTLLHGDTQQNNFLSTAEGAVLVDAAPFFGHPENDLSMLDLFVPVPNDVFDAYRELRMIGDGFEERRELWRIPMYLAIIAVDGSSDFGRPYISHLDRALRTFS